LFSHLIKNEVVFAVWRAFEDLLFAPHFDFIEKIKREQLK